MAATVLAGMVLVLLLVPVTDLAAGTRATDAATELTRLGLEPKRTLLQLETQLRGDGAAVLSGRPGLPVLLLGCESTGCVGTQTVAIATASRASTRATGLTDVFAAGGRWAVAVPAKPGEAIALGWQGDGFDVRKTFSLPADGRIAIVLRGKTDLRLLTAAPSGEYAWQVARGLRARGDRLGAIATLEAAVQSGFKLPVGARVLKADLLRDEGLVGAAARQYTDLRNAPGEAGARARIGLARIALDLGRAEDALGVLLTIQLPAGVPLRGTVTELSLQAFLALERVGDISTDLPNPGGDPFAMLNRAIAYHRAGDPFSAISELRRAERAINRSVPEERYLRERILLLLANLYAEQGNLDRAMAAYDRVNPAGPFRDRLRFGRALAYYFNGDLVRAVAEFQGVVADSPDSPYAREAMMALADAYRRLNAPRQAVAEYREALSRFRQRIEMLDQLLVHASEGSFQDGLISWVFDADGATKGQVVASSPEGVAARLLLAPGFLDIVDSYHQIKLAADRLTTLETGFRRAGNGAMAGKVAAVAKRWNAYRTQYESGARAEVIRLLNAERDQVEALSVSVSLGITQSILFEGEGLAAKGLVFEATQ